MGDPMGGTLPGRFGRSLFWLFGATAVGRWNRRRSCTRGWCCLGAVLGPCAPVLEPSPGLTLPWWLVPRWSWSGPWPWRSGAAGSCLCAKQSIICTPIAATAPGRIQPATPEAFPALLTLLCLPEGNLLQNAHVQRDAGWTTHDKR